MSTPAQIRGMLLEEALLHMLRGAGYRTVESPVPKSNSLFFEKEWNASGHFFVIVSLSLASGCCLLWVVLTSIFFLFGEHAHLCSIKIRGGPRCKSLIPNLLVNREKEAPLSLLETTSPYAVPAGPT